MKTVSAVRPVAVEVSDPVAPRQSPIGSMQTPRNSINAVTDYLVRPHLPAIHCRQSNKKLAKNEDEPSRR